jgi:hypothetical protein
MRIEAPSRIALALPVVVEERYVLRAVIVGVVLVGHVLKLVDLGFR